MKKQQPVSQKDTISLIDGMLMTSEQHKKYLELEPEWQKVVGIAMRKKATEQLLK